MIHQYHRKPLVHWGCQSSGANSKHVRTTRDDFRLWTLDDSIALLTAHCHQRFLNWMSMTIITTFSTVQDDMFFFSTDVPNKKTHRKIEMKFNKWVFTIESNKMHVILADSADTSPYPERLRTIAMCHDLSDHHCQKKGHAGWLAKTSLKTMSPMRSPKLYEYHLWSLSSW